jgi:tetratricopeptide (TPR) repeat protein
VPASPSRCARRKPRPTQRQLESLRTQHDALQKQIAALPKVAPASAAPAGFERATAPALSDDAVAAAVEAYLKKRPANAADGVLAGGAAKGFDLDSEFDALRGVGYDENPELWKRLHASGKGREALARFEAAVKADPKNVKAQMEYASALLAYMRTDPSDYNLAIRADKAFDDVLAIDDKHWEARFTKAVSYSFWPPLTGKPKQAIGHLETLVAQQETMPAQAHEANTYLILGNLLESSGESAKAREIWAKGMRRHPDSQDLARRFAEANK